MSRAGDSGLIVHAPAPPAIELARFPELLLAAGLPDNLPPVDDWIGTGPAAPFAIKFDPANDEVVVFADDVDISNRFYATRRVIYTDEEAPNHFFLTNAPPQVTLIAETIRLDGVLVVQLLGRGSDNETPAEPGVFSHPPGAAGGRLTMVARRWVVSDSAKLLICVDGRDGREFNLLEEVANGPVAPPGFFKAFRTQRTTAGGHPLSSITTMFDRFDLASPGGSGGQVILGIGAFEFLGQERDAAFFRSRVEDFTSGPRTGECDNMPREVRTKGRPTALGTIFDKDHTVFVTAQGGTGGVGFDLTGAERDWAARGISYDPDTVRRFHQFTFGAQAGEPGSLQLVGPGEEPTTVLPPRVLAAWENRILQSIQSALLDAIRRNSRSEILALLRRYSLLVLHPAPADLAATRDGLLTDLNEKRRILIPPVSHRGVEVQTMSGLSRTLDVFTIGATLENQAAPTTTLLVPRTVAGRSVLGLLEFDPALPDQVRLTVDASLTLEPPLGSALRAVLAKTGEPLSGVFSRWLLSPTTNPPAGVKAISARVLGGTLQCSITLDARSASLPLWQLASSVGLPLEFSFTAQDDPAVTGQGVVLLLSVARRSVTGLILTGTSVKNTENRRISVDYVQLGPDRFLALQPALGIDAGATVALPLPAGTPTDSLSIPAEAVTFEVDPQTIDNDFATANAGDLIERITVRNLLTAFVDSRQQALNFVEVNLEQLLREGSAKAGPFRLAAASAQGSEINVPFFRPTVTPHTYRLTGVVHYQGGGQDVLIPREFQTLIISVDESLLPQLR